MGKSLCTRVDVSTLSGEMRKLDMMNRLANVKNPFQGKTKRVLCVCSAGLLRSPTAAVVLSQSPYEFNTRAAGVNKEYALIPIDGALLFWADEIVAMEEEHGQLLKQMLEKEKIEKPILVLDIPDIFAYKDQKLVELITARYEEISNRRVGDGN